jgi:hypothetical protein
MVIQVVMQGDRMKYYATILVLSLLAISMQGCRKPADQSPGLRSVVPGQEVARGQRRCGKGFNLTPQKTDVGWSFILAPNWNRGAFSNEITTASGIKDTKVMLRSIAPGEEVSLNQSVTVGPPSDPLLRTIAERPPEDILKEIEKYCEQLELIPFDFPGGKKDDG